MTLCVRIVLAEENAGNESQKYWRGVPRGPAGFTLLAPIPQKTPSGNKSGNTRPAVFRQGQGLDHVL